MMFLLHLQNTVVGLYFASNKNVDAKRFTPKLIYAYNELKAKGLKFEIVFVSLDKTQEGMPKYRIIKYHIVNNNK